MTEMSNDSNGGAAVQWDYEYVRDLAWAGLEVSVSRARMRRKGVFLRMYKITVPAKTGLLAAGTDAGTTHNHSQPLATTHASPFTPGSAGSPNRRSFSRNWNLEMLLFQE